MSPYPTVRTVDTAHHMPLKALLNTPGCAACSVLYIHRLLAIISINMMNMDDMICLLFLSRTILMTLKLSYFELILKRWNIRTTLSILNATKPDRKNTGMIVSRSTTPSYDMRNFPIAFPLVHVGYRKSAVHMRRMYSTQNMPVVTHSITLSSP